MVQITINPIILNLIFDELKVDYMVCITRVVEYKLYYGKSEDDMYNNVCCVTRSEARKFLKNPPKELAAISKVTRIWKDELDSRDGKYYPQIQCEEEEFLFERFV